MTVQTRTEIRAREISKKRFEPTRRRSHCPTAGGGARPSPFVQVLQRTTQDLHRRFKWLQVNPKRFHRCGGARHPLSRTAADGFRRCVSGHGLRDRLVPPRGSACSPRCPHRARSELCLGVRQRQRPTTAAIASSDLPGGDGDAACPPPPAKVGAPAKATPRG